MRWLDLDWFWWAWHWLGEVDRLLCYWVQKGSVDQQSCCETSHPIQLWTVINLCWKRWTKKVLWVLRLVVCSLEIEGRRMVLTEKDHPMGETAYTGWRGEGDTGWGSREKNDYWMTDLNKQRRARWDLTNNGVNFTHEQEKRGDQWGFRTKMG